MRAIKIIIWVIAIAIAGGFAVISILPEPDARTVGEVLTARVRLADGQKLYATAGGTYIVTGKEEPLPEAVIADIQVRVKPKSVLVKQEVQTVNSHGEETVAQEESIFWAMKFLSWKLGREVVFVVYGESLDENWENVIPVWFATTSIGDHTSMGIEPGEQAPTLAAAQEWAVAHDASVILIP